MTRTSPTLATLVLSLVAALPLAWAGPGGPAHYQDGSGLTEPVAVQKVNPAYPESARAEKLEGTVILDVLIAKNGEVTGVKLVKGADQDLDAAALAAAAKWRFEPARDADGNPVAVYYTLTFRFRLR